MDSILASKPSASLLSIFIALLPIAVTKAQIVDFEDQNFADANWEIRAESLSPQSSHTFEQRLAGGNPDAYRHMTHTNPVNTVSPGDPTFVNITHERKDWIYDPATQGAIEHIDISMDRIIFDITGDGVSLAEGAVGGVLRIFQAGQPFFPVDSVSLTLREWETERRILLRENDFGIEGNRPDFSADGAPITFGYGRSNTNTGQSAEIVTHHGVDNFIVTIVPIGFEHDHDGQSNGPELATYNEFTEILTIPVVQVVNQFFRAELSLSRLDPIEFRLLAAEELSNPDTDGAAVFSFSDNILRIPEVVAGNLRYRIEFTLVDLNSATFRLSFAQEL